MCEHEFVYVGYGNIKECRHCHITYVKYLEDKIKELIKERDENLGKGFRFAVIPRIGTCFYAGLEGVEDALNSGSCDPKNSFVLEVASITVPKEVSKPYYIVPTYDDLLDK